MANEISATKEELLNELKKSRLMLTFSIDREHHERGEISSILYAVDSIADSTDFNVIFNNLTSHLQELMNFDYLTLFKLNDNIWEPIYSNEQNLSNVSLPNSSLTRRVIGDHQVVVLYDPFLYQEFTAVPSYLTKYFNSVLLGGLSVSDNNYLVILSCRQKLKLDLFSREQFLKYYPLMNQAITMAWFHGAISKEISKKTSGYKKTIDRIKRFVEISNFAYWKTDEFGFFVKDSLDFPLSLHLKNIADELFKNNLMDLKSLDEIYNEEQTSERKDTSVMQNTVYKHDDIYKFITPLKIQGTEYFIGLHGKPNYEENGKFIGYIGVFYDLSEEVRVQQNLESAKRISEDVSRSKTQFLAMMSHEIKTPMQAIVGVLDLLNLTELTDEQKNLIQHVTHSANLLQTLLKDVLDYSRMGSNEMKLEQLEFSVRFTMSSIIKQMLPKAKEQGIELKLEIDDKFPNIIIGDQTRLSQVIFNLIGNAIKFTQYGEVKLKAYVQKNHTLRFEISDTGIGISQDKVKILFHPFRQVDATMTRRFGGTGLGLAICRKIIELMDGQIGVESEIGKGSTFWFVIPPKLPSSTNSVITAKSIVKAENKEQHSEDRKYNILLVEDSKVNQFIIKKMLENIGHTVELANNGLEAIECVEKQEPDLVLMDLQMPEMDGIEATKRIIKYHPKLVILALTANASQTERTECRAAGMIDIVSKPVTIASLKNMFQTFKTNINMSIEDKKKK
ncbi:MAG: response regulator [Succinivibrionaceae bacterium]|nr:response regulator [Succinivibrionaceae bacterium]